MKFIKLTGESADIAILEKINEEAFPENERNLLTDMMATGAEVLGIYEFSEAIGFLVVREYKNLVYVAYLAVRSDSRNRGIGTAVMEEFVNQYFNKMIVVEYEAPDGTVQHGMDCIRRRNYYRRCGFKHTGWYTAYDETEFEIGCAGEDFDIGLFNEFIDYLGTIVEDHIPHPYQKEGF
ncbi:MAG: GNAT family N-acetyltransferase [Saccharofermentans sp.]|nr:GNAT family N-acetyltransferase [Saccharofermentans sp.]